MTADVDAPVTDAASAESVPPRRASLRTVLIAIIAIAALAIAAAGGFVWGRDSKSTAYVPAVGSVDLGFAQDMTVHHSQAVTMASYARDYTDLPALKLLAYDIEEQQAFQIGQMQGWIDTWAAPTTDGSPMAWMAGHDHLVGGLMPGMATPAEVAKLQTLHGKALDILFLQLMIRHHQGGIPMAQYAVANAKLAYVRDLAQAIVNAQSSEIISMEQMLRQLGGAPLPAPPTH
jgi:uncharacterized protein (DUF305 family)